MENNQKQPFYPNQPYQNQPTMDSNQGYPPMQQQQQFYPPPQQGYVPVGGYQAPGQQTGYGMPTNANGMSHPTRIQCLTCKQEVTTEVMIESGGGMWTIVVILVICVCPCAWIPCCMDDCKDRVHFCPNCRSNVGIHEYKPF